MFFGPVNRLHTVADAEFLEQIVNMRFDCVHTEIGFSAMSTLEAPVAVKSRESDASFWLKGFG